MSEIQRLNFFIKDYSVNHLYKGKISISKDILNECMDSLFMYWEYMIGKNKDKNHTLYISNEAYLEMSCFDKLKKVTIPDEKGMKRKYIMKKEGVYVTKNEKSIIAPFWFNMIIQAYMGHTHMELSKSFQNQDEVLKDYYTDLQNNLTGNHYRNHFVSVPSNVYG